MAEVEKREAPQLDSLAQRINAEHRAFETAFRKTAEHGIRAGELLTEAKGQCSHGTWLDWLKANFEGSPRTAQGYMRLFHNRDEVRANTQSFAHLGIGAALTELSEPRRVMPSEERVIVERAAALPLGPSFDPERLSRHPEEVRRGFVSEAAYGGLICEARHYSEVMDEARSKIVDRVAGKLAGMDLQQNTPFRVYSRLTSILRESEELLDTNEPLSPTERGFLEEAAPELLAAVDERIEQVRWWLSQVDWLESVVKAKDYPPGRYHPDKTKSGERGHYTLKEMCELGYLEWPAVRIREAYGAIV